MPEDEKSVLEELKEDSRYVKRIEVIEKVLRIHFKNVSDEDHTKFADAKREIEEKLLEVFHDEQDDFEGLEIFAYGVFTLIKNIRNELFSQEDVGPEEDKLEALFVALFRDYIDDPEKKFREAYDQLHENRFLDYAYGRKTTPELTQKGKEASEQP